MGLTISKVSKMFGISRTILIPSIITITKSLILQEMILIGTVITIAIKIQNSTAPNSPTPKKLKFPKGIVTTQERNTLISKNQTLKIDNQRTNDLFAELREIDVNKYTNTVSLALRSLIEFSVNFFLEKYGQEICSNFLSKLQGKNR